MLIEPKHVAIIMDGNGRWAERKMLPRVAGHRRGVESARSVVQHCVNIKLPILTLFAFSSENWQRPLPEVKLLMSLLHNLLVNEIQELSKNNVKLRVIGDPQRLAPRLQTAIKAAHDLTAQNTGLQLNIAINYGGRWDIAQAARAMCVDVVAGKMPLAEIDETTFGNYISLSDLPQPDLLIRTSGEQRISNFLLWQLAYAEIYFTPILWPDFNAQDFDEAVEFYTARERRFGLVTAPLSKVENV